MFLFGFVVFVVEWYFWVFLVWGWVFFFWGGGGGGGLVFCCCNGWTVCSFHSKSPTLFSEVSHSSTLLESIFVSEWIKH